MKALRSLVAALERLNESPSEKEGKCHSAAGDNARLGASMKVPPKRKGNEILRRRNLRTRHASMKVPPKRKGNYMHAMQKRPLYMPQ